MVSLLCHSDRAVVTTGEGSAVMGECMRYAALLCATAGFAWIGKISFDLAAVGLDEDLADALRYGTALVIAGLLLAAVSYALSDDDAVSVSRWLRTSRRRLFKENSNVSTL